MRGFTNCNQIPGWASSRECWFTEYEFGRIYTDTSGRTTEIHGAIYIEWLDNPNLNQRFSIPDYDEAPTPDGRGRFSIADGMHIFWTPETGAWPVHHWFYRVWEQIGIGNPAWGYPIGDYVADFGAHCPQNGFYSLNAQPFEAGWVCADLERAWVIPY